MSCIQRRRKYMVALLLVLLTGYQLVRVIEFANTFGGIDHDSGEVLGISRSLAEQGTYTVLYNTFSDPTILDGGIGNDKRYNVQTADGQMWYVVSGTTGPTSVVPAALIMKLFGVSFWTLRAGPLLFYILFLLLASLFVYRVGGLWSVLLFHLFIFCYPRLSVFLSYEALGEVPAMVFVLAELLVFAMLLRTIQHRRALFLATGLLVGMGLITKLITLLSTAGILVWLAVLLLVGNVWSKSGQPRDKRNPLDEPKGLPGNVTGVPVGLTDPIGLFLGMAVIPALWLIVKMVGFVRISGWQAFAGHVQQSLAFFRDQGSGLGAKTHQGAAFLSRKFLMLGEVTYPAVWVTIIVFAFLLLGTLLVVWGGYRKDEAHTEMGDARNLLMPMWIGWLVNTTWFVFVAKTGWPRHYWFGLILACLLLSVVPVRLIRVGLESWRRRGNPGWQWWGRVVAGGGGLMLSAMILWGFVSQPHVWSLFIQDSIVPYWFDQQYRYIDAVGLPWIIIPRMAQEQVIEYIREMPAEAKVYYAAGHTAAEISAQTGQVEFPIERRSHPANTPHPQDVIVVPPSILSPWRRDAVMWGELVALAERSCPTPVVRNDFYMVCLADDVQMP